MQPIPKTPLITFKSYLSHPFFFQRLWKIKGAWSEGQEVPAVFFSPFITYLSLHNIFNAYFYKILPLGNIRNQTCVFTSIAVSSLFSHLQRRLCKQYIADILFLNPKGAYESFSQKCYQKKKKKEIIQIKFHWSWPISHLL